MHVREAWNTNIRDIRCQSAPTSHCLVHHHLLHRKNGVHLRISGTTLSMLVGERGVAKDHPGMIVVCGQGDHGQLQLAFVLSIRSHVMVHPPECDSEQ
jgi:hypothetical protein